jgi:hypothetical protein
MTEPFLAVDWPGGNKIGGGHLAMSAAVPPNQPTNQPTNLSVTVLLLKPGDQASE